MESICKIIKTILWVMVLSHSLGCIGQNVYNSKHIYYNMDTTRCVDSDARFWDGNKIIPFAGNPDSVGLYCVLKKNIELPIVTLNDEKLINYLESCLFNTSVNSNYLQKPDSSGYFVELVLFENTNDSSMLDMSVTPIPNYYMARKLASDMNEMLFEWQGYYSRNLQCCFFLNDILFVVVSFGRVDFERASCLFSRTNSTLKLVILSPIVWKVSNDKWDNYDYFFRDCSYIFAPTGIKDK